MSILKLVEELANTALFKINNDIFEKYSKELGGDLGDNLASWKVKLSKRQEGLADSLKIVQLENRLSTEL